jgi:AcrR family transcriptional regulator
MPRKKSAPAPQTAVRERLLDTADRLFYKEGVRAVGIDRVLAEAGAAKASLYSHFGCKDDLVAAHVERRVTDARTQIEAYVADIPPAERALRFFDLVVEWTKSRDFRGCPLQHVVAELSDPKHPARAVVTAQREWLHAKFLEWARAAGVANPAATAGALVVLFDGAIAASEHDGPRRARDARWLAEQLLSR